MKVKYLLMAGLSVMMLGACNDKEDVTPVPDNKPAVEGEGKMVLNLKYASGSLPKAGAFAEGEGAESNVTNVHIYFFEDNQEKTWIGHSAATIISQNPGAGNVESKIEITVPTKVVQSFVSESDKANIIVILNKHENLAESGYADFAAFNEALSGIGDNAGFMMSNSTYKENDAIKYFVEIDESNIAQVGAGTPPVPVTVYVERLCSKVTLKVGSLEEGNTPANAKVDMKTWGLNVKNTKEYPVKKLDDATFLGLQVNDWPGAALWNQADNYRSYWAIDPNYSTFDPADFTIIRFADLDTKQGQSEYCLENTFDYNHQMMNRTTTAVIYAQFTPVVDDGDQSIRPAAHATWIAMNNQFYSENTFTGNFLAGRNIYKLEGSSYVSPDGSDVEFTYTAIQGGESDTQIIGGTDYKLAAKTDSPVTLYKFNGTDISNPSTADFAEYSDADWTELNAAFAEYCANAKIYINGYCYYEIPIRHFTDTEVPMEGDWDGIYAQKHLGRYGVVRNHNYQLTINKVLNPGKPITGNEITPEDEPDDKTPDYYMDVTINVLSWAIRTQDVEL